MYQDGQAWADIYLAYDDSLKQIKQIKKLRHGTGVFKDVVDCEITGSMISDLTELTKKMKHYTLQEFFSISEEDLNNPTYALTERQLQILSLRRTMTNREIAEHLKIEQCTVYCIFKSAIEKILKAKRRQKQNWDFSLTPLQNQIQFLINQGFKNKEIALRLGISEGSVKVHKSNLKKRLRKP